MIDFSTVYMTIIACNIVIVLLTVCFSNDRIMVNAGYRLLGVFAGLTLLRFLLPLEFSFTRTILLPQWVSQFLSSVQHPLLTAGTFPISIWTFFVLVWIVGIVIRGVSLIQKEKELQNAIREFKVDLATQEPYRSLAAQICSERNQKNNFRIVQICGITVPMIHGHSSPCILLPLNYTITDDDWYYVLAHEMSHHFHHDVITKQIIQLITAIYWWNPFSRTLMKQTNTILEMRVDNAVTKSPHYTQDGYMICLIHLIENSVKITELYHSISNLRFLTPEGNQTQKRFEILAKTPSSKKHLYRLGLSLVVACVYILSFAITFEAHYVSPEIEDSTMAPSDEGFCAILREDGTYDIYYEDIFIENTDTLEYHPGIRIYKEKGN